MPMNVGSVAEGRLTSESDRIAAVEMTVLIAQDFGRPELAKPYVVASLRLSCGGSMIMVWGVSRRGGCVAG